MESFELFIFSIVGKVPSSTKKKKNVGYGDLCPIS